MFSFLKSTVYYDIKCSHFSSLTCLAEACTCDVLGEVLWANRVLLTL